MKVLHISSEPEWRGGEQQLAYLVDELYKNNVQQWILCLEGSSLHNYCKKKHLAHFTFSKGFLHQMRTAKQVKAICKKHTIELIHIHDSHAHNFAILAADIFFNSTPLVLSRKVVFPISRNWFSKYKYNHKKIQAIICVSEAVKNILSDNIRNKSKLCTIYDCVDLHSFKGGGSGVLRKQYNISENELIIGNIAALASEKDHITFINTAEMLINKGLKTRFILVGTGNEKNPLESLVKQKGLSDKIIFHGFTLDISAVLRDFDIFLFTSRKEGLGSILLASFAARVPVVATQTGGIPELVKHNETGLLAPIGDSIRLTENIISLIGSPELKGKIVANAYTFVQQFSKEAISKQVLDVYNEITIK